MAQKTSKKKAAKKPTPKPEEFGEGTGVVFADDDDNKKGGDDGEEMEDDEGGVSISDCIALIKSGKITKADWDDLIAAIEEAQVGEDADDPEDPDDQVAAPAAVPGGEAMSDTSGSLASMAAMQASIVTQSAEIAKLKKEGSRDKSVAAALKRLENRDLGGDLETTLTNFFDKSPAGFEMFVDELAKQNPPPKEGDDASTASALSGSSELAMAFADEGAGSVEAATGFEEQYAWLSNNTRPGFTREEFVQDQMRKRAARAS